MAEKCEFQITSRIDPKTGVEWKKSKQYPCDCEGALVRVRGELVEIVMPLCERHVKHVREQYKWEVTNV